MTAVGRVALIGDEGGGDKDGGDEDGGGGGLGGDGELAADDERRRRARWRQRGAGAPGRGGLSTYVGG